MKKVVLTLCIVVIVCLAALAKESPPKKAPLLVATTTSLQDTGFMDELVSRFTKNTGIQVKVIAAGTGEALKMGERGDVDLVFVHSRKAEEEFMKKGFGILRKELMYNYLMIAGPAGDPAGIKKAKTPEEAFKMISSKKCTFVSRADNSGTHKKEMELWNNVRIKPEGSWYIQSGGSMAQALRMADEKNGYVLTDESSFNVLKSSLSLKPYVTKKQALRNVYSVIIVNPKKLPKVNYKAAQMFKKFLSTGETQNFIKNFKDENGNILFNLCSSKKS